MTLILFVLDGTIVDSRLDLANSTNEMLRSYGASELPTDEVATFVGEGARVLVQRALTAAGLAEDAGDYLGARSLYEQALALFRELGDARGTSRVPRRVGFRVGR